MSALMAAVPFVILFGYGGGLLSILIDVGLVVAVVILSRGVLTGGRSGEDAELG